MRYKVERVGKYCWSVVDSSGIDKNIRFASEENTIDYCEIKNIENRPIKTQIQQHTEHLRYAIESIRSTLKIMERELETIEGIG